MMAEKEMENMSADPSAVAVEGPTPTSFIPATRKHDPHRR